MILLLTLIVLAPLTVLTLAFVIEVFAGLRPLRGEWVPPGRLPRTTIVVPAHDEAAILESRLRALKAAALDQASILLVADNCSDATAEIGRSLGVDVIERHDPQRRGKGFALDFARDHLRGSPPDVVVIIDADCAMEAKSIGSLSAQCLASGRPCQATNVQVPAIDSSPAVQLSTFAFFVKNVIRQRALQRLAGRGQLLGTGMAFPWRIFEAADLATGEIVEDLKLGLELAEQGHPPLFMEQALVTSDAETANNTIAQRQRWEGGFLRTAVHVAPSLLLKSLRRGDVGAAWAGISLLIPPIALLVLVDVLGLALVLALGWLGGLGIWPVLVLITLLSGLAAAIISAWLAGGSQFVSLRALGHVPLYVLWKLPLYLGVARSGAPEQWKRTERGDGTHRTTESAHRKRSM